MNFNLKPIKKLIMASIILHIIALCAAAILLVFLQRPLWPLFTSTNFPEGGALFLPPFILIAPIIVIFILHLCVTISFLRAIKCDNSHLKQLHTLSIYSLIAVSAILPVLYFVWGYLEHFLAFQSFSTADGFLVFIALRNLMAFGLIIRDISMTVLLIAASMSWYYCFIKKTENNEVYK